MREDSKAIKQNDKQKTNILAFVPTAEYYFSKGIKAYNRRDFNKAKKYFLRALQLEPGEPMITCQLAVLHTEIGEYQQSNRLLHQILDELDEELYECHYFLANNYAHLGLFKDAHHHAKLYLELDPEGEFLADTEELLDVLLLESDDIEGEYYEQDDLIVYQEQARNLLEKGQYTEAIELLNTIVKEYPEYWSGYNNLAIANFYIGKQKKAYDILHDVLNKNPGNLHALCNLLVFAHDRNDQHEIQKLKTILEKIKPISPEHMHKLGTAFALVGEYDLAYPLLRKLYKQGYDMGSSFYYWLAYSAYFTGHEQSAKIFWKKAIEVNPKKAGSEPWNADATNKPGLEEQLPAIMKRFKSEYLEERMLAIFLTAVSPKKSEILASVQKEGVTLVSSVEQDYLASIQSSSPDATKPFPAHDVAKLLYHNNHPVQLIDTGLYLTWFTVYLKALEQGQSLKNTAAWCAAIEYIWLQLSKQGTTQTVMAKRYNLSPATVGKYVKLVKKLLD